MLYNPSQQMEVMELKHYIDGRVINYTGVTVVSAVDELK